MARQYHGRRFVRFVPVESPWERAEREEQRFRRRHDRLHRLRLLHPDEPSAPYRADVGDDNDAPEADARDNPLDDK
jgi:hypothetical protein